MNEYEPLKLDVAPMPAQGMAFATTCCTGNGRKLPAEPKHQQLWLEGNEPRGSD